jgi:hypothetical protein
MTRDRGTLAARPDCRAGAALDGAFTADVLTAPLIDRNGRQTPLRAVDGMWSAAEAANTIGASSLTIRLWCRAFSIGTPFQPAATARFFVHPIPAMTIARLRDARGALPPHACEPGSHRYHIVKLAVLAALKARNVPPDDVIAVFRRRLCLPPYPDERRPPPAVPRGQSLGQPVEVRHGAT